MNLYEKILTIYPGLSEENFINGKIELSNDGDGDCISYWGIAEPMPTQSQLNPLNNLPYKMRVPLVSMRQARLALLSAGLLDDVNLHIVGMSKAVQIEWEYASEVDRNSDLISQLAVELGFSESQIDDLFVQAIAL